MNVIATQYEGYYILIVCGVYFRGEGNWQNVPLPERKEIVRLLLLTAAALEAA